MTFPASSKKLCHANFFSENRFVHVFPSFGYWSACADMTCLLGRKSRLQLDLDVHTSRELQVHQTVDGLVGRPQDVDEPLVGPPLKLLAAVLVLVDGAQDGHDLFHGGQGDGTGDPSAVRLRSR